MTKLNFANISIRFGEKELLDYKELVTRAFLDPSKKRGYGATSYFFFQTKIDYLDPADPLSLAIFGRFVKDTVVSREQVYLSGRLQRDEYSIQNAPSAFFFLIADHRLIYVPETSFPPTLKSLESTLALFIKREFKVFVDEYYRVMKDQDTKFTRKKAFEHHIPPTVRLVPLTSAESIDSFLARFTKLETLTVQLVERNQDMKNGDLFEKLVGKVEPLSPSSAKLEVRGSGEGLVLSEAADFVKETTEGGYEEVSLRGRGLAGEQLSGTNEDFKLQVSTSLDGLNDFAKAAELVRIYSELKQSGSIRVSPRNVTELTPILAEILSVSNEQK